MANRGLEIYIPSKDVFFPAFRKPRVVFLFWSTAPVELETPSFIKYIDTGDEKAVYLCYVFNKLSETDIDNLLSSCTKITLCNTDIKFYCSETPVNDLEKRVFLGKVFKHDCSKMILNEIKAYLFDLNSFEKKITPESGPPHKPRFRCELKETLPCCNDTRTVVDFGSTKKAAEELAAENMIKMLSDHVDEADENHYVVYRCK